MTTQDEIISAATLLQAGGLVAFPTETVYGLGANALDDNAVAAIYALKQRPSFNPLIVHVHSLGQAKCYANVNEMAQKLAASFWPGPLTLVMQQSDGCKISSLVTAGLQTVAVRMPAHPLARALLQKADIPLAAPSANRFGRVSPTCAQHVRDEFGANCPMALDGGACSVGLESTVLDVSGGKPVILRPGSITREMVEAVLQQPVGVVSEGSAITAPGMLASHYAPSLPVRLNATEVQPDEALLAFGANVPFGAAYTLNLSESGNMVEAATNIFAYLRLLDKPEFCGIAVMSIPNAGIGIAINDRLQRAAKR